jgi:hypothetical protein
MMVIEGANANFDLGKIQQNKYLSKYNIIDICSFLY